MNISVLANMSKLHAGLSDPTRLRILCYLDGGERCVASFTEILDESQPKISRHLAYLRDCGLVETRRDGKWIYYRISQQSDPAVEHAFAATLEALRSVEPTSSKESESFSVRSGSHAETGRVSEIELESFRAEAVLDRACNEIEDYLL